jgi:hypothetical protein
MTSYDLHIGRKRTDVSIHPDPVWPQMWRVHQVQGDRVSDMVNLSRAKDAGIGWALAGRGGLKKGERVSWHMGVARPEAPQSDVAANHENLISVAPALAGEPAE